MTTDTSLIRLFSYLKGFHLSDSLVLIGAINSALKYNNKSFNQEGIAPYVIDWLKLHCKTPQNYLTIYIDTGRLARYLLLSGANDHRSKSLDLRNDSFAIALNMTGAVYDTELEKKLLAEQGARGILARISQRQFALQGEKQHILGRGYLLFVQLAERLKVEYSFTEKMKEYFGIGAFEFVATGMTLWMKTNGYEGDLLAIGIPAMKKVASHHHQSIFLKLSSGSPEEYRRYIRGDNWKSSDQLKDTYGAEPFNRMPAIEINHSMLYKAGAYVIPQPWYFFDRASSGIFYLLADKEQEIGRAAGHKGQNPFRKEFGHIYRTYAGIHLGQKNTKFSFIDMDDDFVNDLGTRIPDFALIKNDICILIEIKTTLLKIEARSSFDPRTLKAEIQEGSFKKAITQLQIFGEHILGNRVTDKRFAGISRVIKLIIGYEDVYVLNTLLLPMLEEEYGESARDLQLGAVSDLDVMGTMISEEKDIVSLIAEKVDDADQRYFAFIALWEREVRKKNPILRRSFNELFTRMAGDADI
jgi:hypothetical protein